MDLCRNDEDHEDQDILRNRVLTFVKRVSEDKKTFLSNVSELKILILLNNVTVNITWGL